MRMAKKKTEKQEAGMGQYLAATIGLAVAGYGLYCLVKDAATLVKDTLDAALDLALAEGMRLRAARVRHWRGRLTQEEHQQWARQGVLGGGELRQVDAPVYNKRLEAELVERYSEGPVVHTHEAIWVQRAGGGWALLEATLVSGNQNTLGIPAVVASELGYADETGEPLPQFKPQWSPATTTVVYNDTVLTVPRLRTISLSIAGREFTEGAVILPTATEQSFREGLRAARQERGRPRQFEESVLESWADAGAARYAAVRSRAILVPASMIRKLRQQGISFHP